jgi:hypothetical protein
MSYLTDLIIAEFHKRGRVWPADADDALDWAITEIAECKELTLDRRAQQRGKGWVRNNPEKHDGYSDERLLDELCDVMYMVQIAGIVEGVDVLDTLHDRLVRQVIPDIDIEE